MATVIHNIINDPDKLVAFPKFFSLKKYKNVVQYYQNELIDSSVSKYYRYERMKKSHSSKDKLKDTLKITSAELIEEIAKADRIMSAIGDGVCILDRTFKILYENQVHKNIMGDNEGKFCYRAYQKRDGICTGCPVALTFKDGKIHTVQRDLRHDAETIYFEITASPLKDSKGNIIAGIELVRDITKRKKAEIQLKENEEKLKSIFRASPAGIGVVSSPDRILLNVNERLCRMLGYSSEELVGNSARMLYSSDEDFDYVGKRKYEIIKEHGVGTVETRWKCKDGRIIDVLLSSSPIDIENPSTGITFTVMDITEKKISESLLKENKEELQKKVKALEDFYDVAVGRELRMKQLKEEMERLKGELSKYKEK